MRWLLLLVVVVAGCASAGIDGNPGNNDGNPGSDGDNPQGDGGPDIDAPPPDAALTEVNLVQTGATNIVATEIGCQNTSTQVTQENSYYRTFPLSDFGVTAPLQVTEVTFAVERATANGAASQPAQLKLGTYAGTINANSFAINQLQLIASASIQIPNGATQVTTPISAFTPSTVTVPADRVLYAELFIPDADATGHIFYIGSNNGSETHPSYIRAPDCGIQSPTTYASAVGSPPIRILLSVKGVF